MAKRIANIWVRRVLAILATVSLAATLAACSSDSCERSGTCYQAPQPFYGGSYYMQRGGFTYGGRGGAR